VNLNQEIELETVLKPSIQRPTPFLKWAGGKSQLLPILERHLPSRFETYFEPFLGGGALFFHLVAKGRVTRAVISDFNKDLINCYVAIRDHLDMLLVQLKELQTHTRDKKFYYEVARPRFNSLALPTGLEGDPEKAALLFFLNKTCYNGLYRVNQKGAFNVPWGRYKNPRIHDENNLKVIHKVLRQAGICILCADYREATRTATKEDFIYFDPPYQPLSRTANFTSYTPQSFGPTDQASLAQLFSELDRRECHLMLSNSPRVARLYEASHKYHIERVKAARPISCIGDKRGPVDELLVMNYYKRRSRGFA
jgi:DNA adenine methylase